ncbi:ATP-dependent RNA helicase DbpA [Nitzschia inconspicua]|uniref:ATP-dependent RNA helicase n=1 Tax=Nitzschia inconspicua TaxID=303405 RepID=A0A9K3KE28_9STRA|nr:ATP-dependent RNA helicase DbpA [Nitzschia inconspicua]
MVFSLHGRRHVCKRLALQRWHRMKSEKMPSVDSDVVRPFSVAAAPVLSIVRRNARPSSLTSSMVSGLSGHPAAFFSTSSVPKAFIDSPIERDQEEMSTDAFREELRFPTRFEELGLHPKTLKALRRQGLHRLTEVQQQTFHAIFKGKNVVARSRTGTGKTMAFLIPALERLLEQQHEHNIVDEPYSQHPPRHGIQILILVPTRELAVQIHQETEKLLQFHHKANPNLTSQVLYGGSFKEQDIRQFQKALPTILVATPGRLKDHLATTTLTYSTKDGDDDSATTTIHVPFRKCLQSLQTLVLDETDRLLAMGFRRDIIDILSAIPAVANGEAKRQTLLFSATLPKDVLDVVDLAMPKAPSVDDRLIDQAFTHSNYQLIDCIQESDPTTHTNDNTIQSYMILPSERFWKGSMEYILELLEGGTNNYNNNKKKKNHSQKIIVFFPMTRLVQLYYKFFTDRLGYGRVWELHGKMYQRDRNVVARRFRNTPSGLLLTSDVSARGVDYPDVTHVVQVGAAPSRETYIHRLGRCGRAGKRGEGMLILPEIEQDFLHELEGLNIDPLDERTQEHMISKLNSRHLENELGLLQQDLRRGQDDSEIQKALHMAYHAMISYFFQTCRDKQQSPEQVVTTLNQLLQDFGLSELPPIEFERAKKMGIETLPGLNIRKTWDDIMSSSNQNSPPPTTSSSEEFQRKPYGEFDDWFGVNKNNINNSNSRQEPVSRPLSEPPKYRSTTDSANRNNYFSKRDQSNVDSKRRKSNQQAPTVAFKDRRQQSRRLDKFQRWEVQGELLEKS